MTLVFVAAFFSGVICGVVPIVIFACCAMWSMYESDADAQ